MRSQNFLNKIIFYFENAPQRSATNIDESFINKARVFLQELKPQRLWEEKGLMNRKINKSVYPDFVMVLDDKIIACEVVKINPRHKYDLYNGIKIFDEIWFFTDIPIEKEWLHYKLENNMKIRQKFYGLNGEGKITLIMEIH
jgi:hypothetical protein